jgi:hypothetical protein
MTPRLTVALDVAKGEPPKEVSFVVGENGKAGEFDRFKLGYAGTIHKGQGDTYDVPYVCHSPQWRGSASYVALTRHREEVQIFASRETVRSMDARGMDRNADSFGLATAQAALDPEGLAAARSAHALDVMAKGLERPENKRAATAYQLDDTSALRLDFDDAAQQAATATPTTREEPAQTATAAQESDRDPTAAAEIGADEKTARDAPEATAAATATSPQDSEAEKESPLENAIDAVQHIAGEVAGAAKKAVDVLFGALMGETKPAPKPMTARERHAAGIAEAREAEKQQRAARSQEIARSLGASDALTPEELQREKEAQEKRSRDRGGGQSL